MSAPKLDLQQTKAALREVLAAFSIPANADRIAAVKVPNMRKKKKKKLVFHK
jgi:hypothetical protein